MPDNVQRQYLFTGSNSTEVNPMSGTKKCFAYWTFSADL